MKIIETNLSFGSMSSRNITTRIILHHAAADVCSASDIHTWHKENGWAGAGYHFLVRKEGNVYRLRPEKYVGAHAIGANNDSIGICFEGNFENGQMSEKQKAAGVELISYLKGKYNISKMQGHRDVNNTNCPGKYFPLTEIKERGSNNKKIVKQPTLIKSTRSVYKKEWILKLQAECNRQGFSNQVVDGIYGPITLAGCPTLLYGASGNITRLMQQRLTTLSFPCGNIDGVFGVLTRSAVRSFQKSRNLVVDGIVGPKTWKALCVA